MLSFPFPRTYFLKGSRLILNLTFDYKKLLTHDQIDL